MVPADEKLQESEVDKFDKFEKLYDKLSLEHRTTLEEQLRVTLKALADEDQYANFIIQLKIFHTRVCAFCLTDIADQAGGDHTAAIIAGCMEKGLEKNISNFQFVRDRLFFLLDCFDKAFIGEIAHPVTEFYTKLLGVESYKTRSEEDERRYHVSSFFYSFKKEAQAQPTKTIPSLATLSVVNAGIQLSPDKPPVFFFKYENEALTKELQQRLKKETFKYPIHLKKANYSKTCRDFLVEQRKNFSPKIQTTLSPQGTPVVSYEGKKPGFLASLFGKLSPFYCRYQQNQRTTKLLQLLADYQFEKIIAAEFVVKLEDWLDKNNLSLFDKAFDAAKYALVQAVQKLTSDFEKEYLQKETAKFDSQFILEKQEDAPDRAVSPDDLSVDTDVSERVPQGRANTKKLTDLLGSKTTLSAGGAECVIDEEQEIAKEKTSALAKEVFEIEKHLCTMFSLYQRTPGTKEEKDAVARQCLGMASGG